MRLCDAAGNIATILVNELWSCSHFTRQSLSVKRSACLSFHATAVCHSCEMCSYENDASTFLLYTVRFNPMILMIHYCWKILFLSMHIHNGGKNLCDSWKVNTCLFLLIHSDCFSLSITWNVVELRSSQIDPQQRQEFEYHFIHFMRHLMQTHSVEKIKMQKLGKKPI